MNLLFICSRNQWRSPTAEHIYKNNNEHQVRSAGTSASARIKVTARMILWADVIFAMEKEHKQRLIKTFPQEIASKKVVVLDIPDEYKFMDEKLVAMIKAGVGFG